MILGHSHIYYAHLVDVPRPSASGEGISEGSYTEREHIIQQHCKPMLTSLLLFTNVQGESIYIYVQSYVSVTEMLVMLHIDKYNVKVFQHFILESIK